MLFKSRSRLIGLCKSYKKSAGATLAVVIIIAVLLYVITPLLIKHHLNNTVLTDMGQYQGYVGDVDWRISRFAYSVQNIALTRKKADHDLPFFYAQDLIVSLSAEALLRGKLRVNVVVDKAELNFIDSPEESRRQAGSGTNWLEVSRNLLPARVHNLSLREGTIRFTNKDVEPEVTLAARQIHAQLKNLSKVLADVDGYSASGELKAVVQDSGTLNANVRFEAEQFDHFLFEAKAAHVKLVELNRFAKAYGNIDFQSGVGDILIELKANDGELTGYAKPFFKNVSIANWQQDVMEQGDNPIDLLWEFGWEVVKAVVTNQNTNEIATTIDISGSISQAEMESWPIFFGVIKNAFVQSLENGYDIDFSGDAKQAGETTDGNSGDGNGGLEGEPDKESASDKTSLSKSRSASREARE